MFSIRSRTDAAEEQFLLRPRELTEIGVVATVGAPDSTGIESGFGLAFRRRGEEAAA
jgi:hypothetical protein